jgi:UDPglucose 6-dehydrogenase
MKNTFIGFIGNGFVGKNLADNFEERGFTNIVRYDISPRYLKNKDRIKECKIVFVCVPTPSTPRGFDSSILYDVMNLISKGTTVIIKSTVPFDIMRDLQYTFSNITFMLCPEFLTESTAKIDTDKPERNIIGISNKSNPELYNKAKEILSILPESSYSKICSFEEASLAKYGGNCFFVVKNMFFNILYDLAKSSDADWNILQDIIIHDSRIHSVHTNPVHNGGRGAGNHCLIKDFAEFENLIKIFLPNDDNAKRLINVNVAKNLELLKNSGKDLNLIDGVYGKQFDRKHSAVFPIELCNRVIKYYSFVDDKESLLSKIKNKLNIK